MRIANLKITHKIAATGIIGVVGLMTVAMLHAYGSHASEAIQQRAARAYSIERLTIHLNDTIVEARRTDKDFLLTSDESLSIRHGEFSRQVFLQIATLKTQVLAAGNLQLAGNIDRIRDGYLDYDRHFEHVVSLRRILGFNERLGVQGTLQRAAEDVETLATRSNQPNVRILLLQLRQHEKNFMLWQSTESRDLIKRVADEFSHAVATSTLPPAAKMNMLSKFSSYYDGVQTWTETWLSYKAEMTAAAAARDALEPIIATMLQDVGAIRASENAAAAASHADTTAHMTLAILLVTVVVALVVRSLGYSISRPLQALARAMSALADGNLSIRLPGLNRRDEIGDMAAAMETFRLKATERALRDPLTGLGNRAFFLQEAERSIARLPESGEGLALILLDLDHFKTINDSCGHPAADQLLRIVAQRIHGCIGESDSAIRLGGDEFVVLHHIKDEGDTGAALAERLLQTINRPCQIGDRTITAQTSIGIACTGGDTPHSVDTMLANADFALYRVKSEGRNGYRLFGADMDEELRTRRTLQLDLTEALTRNEFELHFQPIVDLLSQETRGVEALLRWRHPRHGLIMPARFITLAEEIGMISHIGSWVLEEACRCAVEWPKQIKVAVNVSTLQIQGGSLIPSTLSALAKSGLSPARLEIELTESALLRNDAKTLATLQQLKKIGVAIVLDDFGTGYSSLTYLRLFPFDKIKIDRTFVSEMSTNHECAAIVAAVVNLARGLDMVATAEGVETQEQVDLLRAAGCTQAQGYLFDKARPASEIRFLPPKPEFDLEWIDNPLPEAARA